MEENECINGTFDQGKCICNTFYEGKYCDQYWDNVHHHYREVFITYSVFACLVQFILLVYSAFILIKTVIMVRRQNTQMWTTSTFMAIGIFVSSLMRVIIQSVDSHQYLHNVPTYVEAFLFNLPIWIWLNVAAMLLLYWVELTQKNSVTRLKTYLSRLRWILYILMSASLAILLFCILATAKVEEETMWNVYSGLIVAYQLILMGLAFFYGRNLLKIIEELYKSTQATHFKDFLKKITIFIFIFEIILGILAIGLIIFYAFSLYLNAWPFVFWNWGFRIFEFAGLFMLLWIITRERAEKDEQTEGEASIEMKTSNSGNEGLNKSSSVMSKSSYLDNSQE